uniref:Glutaredoxin domain-containing protein n=1 Tax=Cannabis sativa TaxID=3483 RepID=A0A803Q6R8_CANSA
MDSSPINVLKTEDQSLGQEGNKFSDSNSEKSLEFESEKMSDAKMICDVEILQPHSLLPKPEAPPGLLDSPSVKNDIVLDHLPLENFSVDIPAIGKFIRERSNSFSAAIAKKLSSFKENLDEPKSPAMSEFNISGLRVVVKLKNDDNKKDKEVIKGRISFFSRSNCRDCTAVRQFFREKGLKFVEINIDVYPRREKELVERTGSSSVPQIFFNEKLFGGLVALNSLRNSGDFDRRLREMVASKCPDDAPSPPVYGFDDDPEEEEESTEEIVWIVRVLRQRLPIQDRLMKMKIVKNCFAGCEMVEALIHHLDCGRKKVRPLKSYPLCRGCTVTYGVAF